MPANGVRQSLSNPDLIREYLIKTHIPPAIFKPIPITTYNPLKAPQQKFCDMAYKHPQLLIHNANVNGLDQVDACNNTHNTTVADIELATNGVADDPKHIRYDSMLKRNLFGADNLNVNQIAQKAIDSSCKLIGNVKPNLVKTWEQLNRARPTTKQQMIAYPGYVIDDDCLRTDLAIEQTSTEHSNETFIMSGRSKSHTTRTDDHFYDSIDNESIITEQCDDDQIISSLGFDMEDGGEAMAEYLSIVEKKEKLCWSVDSCN